MKLDDFRNRKVLPTPLDVMGLPDNRRINSVNLPSGVTTESKSTEQPKKQSNLPKPKPKKNADRDRDERGGNINLALQRPPKKPKD